MKIIGIIVIFIFAILNGIVEGWRAFIREL
jgi:hypothetical protein